MTGAFIAIDDYGKNLKNTLFRLLELGVIPIVNENDTVTTDEIVIGDNDTLGAIIAKAVGADLLIILSDIDGLFTDDPNVNPDAERISVVDEVTDGIEALAGKAGTHLGTGGMITKIKAAKLLTAEGIDMVVANGKNPEVLYDVLNEKGNYTLFRGKKHDD